jgi:hypothetical protein
MAYRPTHKDRIYTDYAVFWETYFNVEGTLDRTHVGGRYTDMSLRVVVDGAPDTLCVFRPQYEHGTSMAVPQLARSGIAFTFSQHIYQAYMRSMVQGEDLEIIVASGYDSDEDEQELG